MNPMPTPCRFIILLLWIALEMKAGIAQPLTLSWQGLPSAYSEAKDWNIIGQSSQGLWFLRQSKRELRLEHRNLRMQLRQSLKIPAYLLQSENIALLNSDSGMHLMFDLFNPSAGEHGLFVSGIHKDSINPEPAQLIFETTENHDPKKLKFDIFMDDNGEAGWIIHGNLSSDQITFKYLRLTGDSKISDSMNLALNAPNLGAGDKAIFIKIHDITKIKEHLFAFLFQYKSSPKDRKKSLWGLGFLNLKEQWIRSAPLNRNDLAEQRLFVNSTPGNDTISVHGFALDERTLWPFTTITYRIPIPRRDYFPELTSTLRVFEPETNRHLLNLRSNEGKNNRVDESYAEMQVHMDGSATLVWRRQFKSVETMVQYSQGLPMYREIIRYHANDWIISRINVDGSHGWDQIVPMNLTTIDRTQQLKSYVLVAGQAILLVGYQSINNRIAPFILQTLADGRVINADLENRLKGQSPLWGQYYTIDQNNILVPSHQNGRDGLLYVHYAKP
jgi:hypothetical protein